MAPLLRLPSVWVAAITAVLSASFVYQLAVSSELDLLQPVLKWIGSSPNQTAPFTCRPQSYTTQIVSLDPLLVYIDSFLSAAEIAALLEAGEAGFAPSTVFKYGQKQGTSDRTSSSAGLPRDNPAVQCVLGRARDFLGSVLDPNRDDIGPAQLVRYTTGQRFNLHHDWYEAPQPSRADARWRGRTWNRAASFFVILEDACTGGETHFPFIDPVTIGRDPIEPSGHDNPTTFRNHEDGGVAFRPVKGNALFWVNLFPNGTGDLRTRHAGLPLEGGLKTAMNIWPRKYYE